MLPLPGRAVIAELLIYSDLRLFTGFIKAASNDWKPTGWVGYSLKYVPAPN